MKLLNTFSLFITSALVFTSCFVTATDVKNSKAAKKNPIEMQISSALTQAMVQQVPNKHLAQKNAAKILEKELATKVKPSQLAGLTLLAE